MHTSCKNACKNGCKIARHTILFPQSALPTHWVPSARVSIRRLQVADKFLNTEVVSLSLLLGEPLSYWKSDLLNLFHSKAKNFKERKLWSRSTNNIHVSQESSKYFLQVLFNKAIYSSIKSNWIFLQPLYMFDKEINFW